jgi:cytochrome P450
MITSVKGLAGEMAAVLTGTDKNAWRATLRAAAVTLRLNDMRAVSGGNGTAEQFCLFFLDEAVHNSRLTNDDVLTALRASVDSGGDLSDAEIRDIVCSIVLGSKVTEAQLWELIGGRIPAASVERARPCVAWRVRTHNESLELA